VSRMWQRRGSQGVFHLCQPGLAQQHVGRKFGIRRLCSLGLTPLVFRAGGPMEFFPEPARDNGLFFAGL